MVTLGFKLEYDSPAFVIKVENQEFVIGMSMYDVDPFLRLHNLFLRLDEKDIKSSVEEFEDEGQESSISFNSGNEDGWSLMTITQTGQRKEDDDRLVKDVKVNNQDLKEEYKHAFTLFIDSLSKEKISEINSDINLAQEIFENLSKN